MWFNLICFVTLIVKCQGAQILMITLCGTLSHKIPFVEIGKALNARSHNITVVSGFKGNGYKNELYTEVTPKKLEKFIEAYFDRDLLGGRMKSLYPISVADVYKFSLGVCSSFYEDEVSSVLMEAHYDLAIIDGVYPECVLGWMYKARIPFMYINTMPFYPGSLARAGNPTLMSFMPHFQAQLTDNMNFLQRAYNFLFYLIVDTLHDILIEILQYNLRSYLGHIPHVYDISANVSFILNGGHPALTYSRPLHANVAHIACVHCKPAKPLSKDLEKFIGAKGFIYVSMGSAISSAKMPKKLRQIMIDAFSRLPYQVLWKWESNTTNLKNLPKNIKLATWFPQQDLLGHKNIKAFISQTGILSMSEAVYHACPLVSIPIFTDQDVNAAKAVSDGYAIIVDLRTITAEILRNTIQSIAEDSKYKNAVLERRELLLDQMNTPMEIALFYIEYVLRHKGAKELLSPSRFLNVWDYYSIDVYAFYFILFWIFWRIWSFYKEIKIVIKTKTD